MDAAPRKKPSHKMPDFVREALEENGLMEAYRERPDYQQNDYIGWIIQAKQQETRERRLSQMVEELKLGDRYMNMSYDGKKQVTFRGVPLQSSLPAWTPSVKHCRSSSAHCLRTQLTF